MEKKRKLFYIERMLFLNGIRSVDPLALIVYGSVKGNVPEERVKHALDKMQIKHPSLRARITEGKYIHYADTDYPPIPLKIVERVSDDTLKIEKEKFIAEPFDFEKGPLVRFLWVRSEEISEFMFIGLHVIINGKSLIQLIKEFYIFINEPDRKIKPYEPILSMKEFLPDVSLSWKDKLIGNIYTEYIRWRLFFATRNKKIQPSKPYALTFPLDKESSEALKNLAENKKVSVGNILCILVAKLFKAHFHPKNPECKVFLSLDLRRYVPAVTRDMIWGGAYTLYMKFQVSDDADVWEMARSFENNLIQRAITDQKEGNWNKIKIGRSIKRSIVFTEYFNRIVGLIVKNMLTASEGQDFSYINLGAVNAGLKNPEFEMNHSVPTPEIHSPVLNSTYFGLGDNHNQNYHFLFASNENYIPKEKMELIVSEFKQSLKELIKEEIVENVL